MIVRITRAKVGHRQVPTKEKPGLMVGLLFCRFPHDDHFSSAPGVQPAPGRRAGEPAEAGHHPRKRQVMWDDEEGQRQDACTR